MAKANPMLVLPAWKNYLTSLGYDQIAVNSIDENDQQLKHHTKEIVEVVESLWKKSEATLEEVDLD